MGTSSTLFEDSYFNCQIILPHKVLHLEHVDGVTCEFFRESRIVIFVSQLHWDDGDFDTETSRQI